MPPGSSLGLGSSLTARRYSTFDYLGHDLACRVSVYMVHSSYRRVPSFLYVQEKSSNIRALFLGISFTCWCIAGPVVGGRWPRGPEGVTAPRTRRSESQ